MKKFDKNKKLDEYYVAYRHLLNEKQQDIYELYYFEDYSINEIAEVREVSKNAVYNMLKRIEEDLIKFEKQLNLIKKNNDILKLVKDDEILLEKINIILKGSYE